MKAVYFLNRYMGVFDSIVWLYIGASEFVLSIIITESDLLHIFSSILC